MAQFVIVLVVLSCVGSFHLGSTLSLDKDYRGRNKRHVGEQSVQSVLQSFISRIDAMHKQVQQQDNTLYRQTKEIRDLKWYLRRKGTKERFGEIQRDVDHQTILMTHAVDIKPLTEFKTSVDKFEKRTKALSAGVQERKKVIDDIYDRIFLQDGKVVCRNAFTSWNKQADYKIGALDKHHIECRDDELLQRFLLVRKDGMLDSEVRFKYRCCRLNLKDKWKKTPKKMASQ